MSGTQATTTVFFPLKKQEVIEIVSNSTKFISTAWYIPIEAGNVTNGVISSSDYYTLGAAVGTPISINTTNLETVFVAGSLYYTLFNYILTQSPQTTRAYIVFLPYNNVTVGGTIPPVSILDTLGNTITDTNGNEFDTVAAVTPPSNTIEFDEMILMNVYKKMSYLTYHVYLLPALLTTPLSGEISFLNADNVILPVLKNIKNVVFPVESYGSYNPFIYFTTCDFENEIVNNQGFTVNPLDDQEGFTTALTNVINNKNYADENLCVINVTGINFLVPLLNFMSLNKIDEHDVRFNSMSTAVLNPDLTSTDPFIQAYFQIPDLTTFNGYTDPYNMQPFLTKQYMAKQVNVLTYLDNREMQAYMPFDKTMLDYSGTAIQNTAEGHATNTYIIDYVYDMIRPYLDSIFRDNTTGRIVVNANTYNNIADKISQEFNVLNARGGTGFFASSSELQGAAPYTVLRLTDEQIASRTIDIIDNANGDFIGERTFDATGLITATFSNGIGIMLVDFTATTLIRITA